MSLVTLWTAKSVRPLWLKATTLTKVSLTQSLLDRALIIGPVTTPSMKAAGSEAFLQTASDAAGKPMSLADRILVDLLSSLQSAIGT